MPINGERCGNPYLRWHHFDPPWREREHHEPGGMIALCAEHHDKADAGAFTVEQLREFKAAGAPPDEQVRGRFDWMREKLLAVVGGNFYYETPVPLQIKGEPVIAFDRDEQSRFLLNVNMPTASGEPRLRIERNDWIEAGSPTDLGCPPHGRLLRVVYPQGDALRIAFQEVPSEQHHVARYAGSALPRYISEHPGEFAYPLLTVEIGMLLVGPVLDLGPRGSTVFVPGITMTGGVAVGCKVGLSLG